MTSRRLLASRPCVFENFQAIKSIQQIDPSLAVQENIIRLHSFLPRARRWNVITDLFRLMRIGNIDDPQSAAEPSEINQAVGHALIALVRAEATAMLGAAPRRVLLRHEIS